MDQRHDFENDREDHTDLVREVAEKFSARNLEFKTAMLSPGEEPSLSRICFHISGRFLFISRSRTHAREKV